MKNKLYKSFMLSLLLLLSACFSMGRNFPSRTDWLQKNKTTKKDMQLLLGKPVSVGNSGGIETWTYGFYSFKVTEKPYYKELKIYWNPDRSVKHYIFNSSFPIDIAKRQVPSPRGPAKSGRLTKRNSESPLAKSRS
mgnify:CR=1 FL=1